MISSSPGCVVLLDIDGTLVTGPDNGPSAGLLAMNRAAYLVTSSDLFGNPGEFTGLTDMEVARRFRLGDPSTFAGRTDVQIARQLLVLAGIDPPPENLVTELVDSREYGGGGAITCRYRITGTDSDVAARTALLGTAPATRSIHRSV